MPNVAVTGQHTITSQEAYELDKQFHGLIVFGLEGADEESNARLTRWLSKRTPGNHHRSDEDLSCRFWVGTTIPCPRTAWRLVEAQLTKCTPAASLFGSRERNNRTFQIGGYFTDPVASADKASVVMFRGKFAKFMVVNPEGESVEGEAGYIKLSLLG